MTEPGCLTCGPRATTDPALGRFNQPDPLAELEAGKRISMLMQPAILCYMVKDPLWARCVWPRGHNYMVKHTDSDSGLNITGGVAMGTRWGWRNGWGITLGAPGPSVN